MDYSESVKHSIEFINSHLEEELSPEIIAYEEGYSVFHFCRIFKEYSGESIMRFVRERRLEASEKEVKNGCHISEVANRYGFETSSGFARAFERKFGVRPSEKLKV